MVVVGIVKLLAADRLFSVINMTFISAGHVFEIRLDLPIFFFVEPNIVTVHIAVFIVIFVVEAHLPQNVFLFMTLRRELVIGVVLLEEAVSVFMALQHCQNTSF